MLGLEDTGSDLRSARARPGTLPLRWLMGLCDAPRDVVRAPGGLVADGVLPVQRAPALLGPRADRGDGVAARRLVDPPGPRVLARFDLPEVVAQPLTGLDAERSEQAEHAPERRHRLVQAPRVTPIEARRLLADSDQLAAPSPDLALMPPSP